MALRDVDGPSKSRKAVEVIAIFVDHRTASSARHTNFGLRSSARHLPRSQLQRAYWPSPFNSSPTTISHPLPVFSTSSLTPRAMSDLCPVYAPFFGAMVSASPPHAGQGTWLTTRRCCPFDALS